MNRIFRLVFNRQLGVMQVASELANSVRSGASQAVLSQSPLLRPLALCVSQVLLLGMDGSAVAADAVIFNGDDRIDNEVTFQDGFIVGSDAAGVLRVVNGGHVTTDRSIVGDQEGGIGTLIVDGPDAWLKFHNSSSQFVSGGLIVGNAGSGALQVLNGGHVEQSSLGELVFFASGETSDANVLVDGQGSLLQAGYFRMGGAGSGAATVSNGGKIVSTSSNSTGIDLAYSTGSNFTLDVLGDGSEVSTGNNIFVGKDGSAALNIRDGGAVKSAGWIYLADGAAASGDILVDGAGSLLSGERGLTLGLEGDASLRVINGATATFSDNLWTSYDSGSSSTLMVDGSGSTLSVTDGNLLIGRAGTSELTVSSGGVVNADDVMVGTSGGSVGSIVVDGVGSQLAVSGDFQVGDSGQGSLDIRNGGQVSAASMLLSDALISAKDATTGKVTVHGAGSTLTIVGDGLLTVGGSGNGTLEISDAGYVSTGNLTIGGTASPYTPTNLLQVGGVGSRLDVTDQLFVGDGEAGQFVVTDGANVTAGSLVQEKGTTTIEGDGTAVSVGDMDISGDFLLDDGASFAADAATFGNGSGVGVAEVSGGGTSLDVAGELNLRGKLEVLDGASVTVGSIANGSSFAVGATELHVTGQGSTLTSRGDVSLIPPLGLGGMLRLSDAGYFSAGDHMVRVGTNAGIAFGAAKAEEPAQVAGAMDANTRIELDGYGVLMLNHTADNLELGNALSSVGYNTDASTDGEVISVAGTTTLSGDLHAFNGDVTVQGGKLIIDSDMNSLPSAYSASGDVGKVYQDIEVSGDGVLVLNGETGYRWQSSAGGSTDTQGSTRVSVYGAASGDHPTLAGSGTLSGDVGVGDGGIISPGDALIGTLTINGDLTFHGLTADLPGVYAVDLAADGTSDLLQVSGVASLHASSGGTVNPSQVQVTALDAATSYQDGQTYTILHADGGVQGTFSDAISRSAFLTPTLSYTANDVVLTIALDTASLPMTVGDGEVLSGTGSYGSVQVLSGGTISPGTASAKIGTLTFNGDLSFAAGAFYDVDLKGTGTGASASSITTAAVDQVNDLVDVTGKATLDGGTVRVTALDPQASYQDGHTYTVLSADGGVSGTFDGATSNSAFLTAALSYDANDVLLKIGVVAAGDVGGGDPGSGDPGTGTPPPIFETVANSRNQYNIAQALDTLPQQGEALALYNRLLMLDADSARAAFGSLSGEIHTATRAGLLEDRFVREGVAQRRAGQAAAGGHDGITGWVSGAGVSDHIDGDGNAAKVQGRREGLLAGVDVALGQDSLVGLAGGHEDITRQVRTWSSTADIDANEIGAYAATHWGALQVSGGVSYADYDVRSQRQTLVGTSAERLHGDYDAHATSVYAEAGWRFGDEALNVTPYLTVAHIRLETDGVTETGGSTALQVAPSKDELLTSTLGARLAWDISAGAHDGAQLTAGLAWQNASGELNADTLAGFVAGGETFRSYGTPLARNVGIAEIGVGVNTGRSSRVSLVGQGRVGDSQHAFGAQLNWAWRF